LGGTSHPSAPPEQREESAIAGRRVSEAEPDRRHADSLRVTARARIHSSLKKNVRRQIAFGNE
jgi:hypothetical protein